MTIRIVFLTCMGVVLGLGSSCGDDVATMQPGGGDGGLVGADAQVPVDSDDDAADSATNDAQQACLTAGSAAVGEPPFSPLMGCHAPVYAPPACQALFDTPYENCTVGTGASRPTVDPSELPCGACDDPGYHCTEHVWPSCECDGDGGIDSFIDGMYSVDFECLCLEGTWHCWLGAVSGAACSICTELLDGGQCLYCRPP
jgi:hypothetical protein